MESFKVTALSNDLAVCNALYLSSLHRKKTLGLLRISGKYFKCNFTEDTEADKIRMSKNLRDFLGVSEADAVKVQFINKAPEDLDLSFVELLLSQVIPKLTEQTTFDEEAILECLRKQEKDAFFNPSELKYVQLNKTVYTVKVNKSYLIMTGDNDAQKQSYKSGRLVNETQIEIKIPQGSMLVQNSKSNQGKSIFRPDFTIADMGIGGLDQQLFNIFRRTFASRRYSSSTIQRFGVKHVKGILLYGPPGTGKTLIARQLAKALNVKDLKIVNGPELLSKFVGESEQNVRKLFLEARNDQNKLGDKSPLHIVVFDEIDAICKQRGMHSGAGSQVTDQVVNQLLTNIDGVEALNNIIVIGMTNRKDLLDDAILRPGRFEVHIQINLPSQEGREQILAIHTKKLRGNNLLGQDCNLHEIAMMTKNFTGAEIEALVKCASSHSLSRTTNILQFSKELQIDEKNLKVEKQDFLKALEEVKAQFGVDQEKFASYFRQKIINYGAGFDRVMSNLQEITASNTSQKLSILLHGRPGTGKTMAAIDFIKHCTFSYLKIISPENYVGMSDSEKIRNISKIFEDAYRTTNACIVVDNLDHLIDYCAVGRRFTNSLLQALLLLLEKIPPKENCKLLIIGTTSACYNLEQVDLSSRFDVKIEVFPLKEAEIATLLIEKYSVGDAKAKQVAKMMRGCTIKELMQLAELVENKETVEEWEFYWHNLVHVKEDQDQL